VSVQALAVKVLGTLRYTTKVTCWNSVSELKPSGAEYQYRFTMWVAEVIGSSGAVESTTFLKVKR
jgi:hypothetical protein